MMLRPYQVLMTFFNFLGTLTNVVVQLPIQFTTSTHFTPPQNVFLWQRDKSQKNGSNSATAQARCHFFKIMQNTQFLICSQYILQA